MPTIHHQKGGRMKKAGILLVSLAVFALGFSSILWAQPKAEKTAPAEKKETMKKTPGDSAFITEAVAGGLFEVEMGKVALQKASNEEVKKFAQRMVDDHSKAVDELMQLAAAKGMSVPKEMKKMHRDTIDKLSKSSGAAFDKGYMDEMVKDHVKDVAAFRKEAKEGKDPEVKAWASKTLPTLEDHLKMALDLSKKEMGKKEPDQKK